ncbi:MAG TPA: hypothetical protein VK523_12150, partial [Steroidobacteraceae bacterium]|nr:hypothetical protein [Steroidobacteraceae bacterium]
GVGAGADAGAGAAAAGGSAAGGSAAGGCAKPVAAARRLAQTKHALIISLHPAAAALEDHSRAAAPS